MKTDIPTVPTNVSAFTNDAGYITGITSSDVTTALGYTPGTSNFSGDYDDLTDKPTIPTVNDPTITFTQGGVTKGTITLNQASNQTIALDAGSTPTNMVTTDTAQDITATKTFTGNASIYVQSGSSYTSYDTLITNQQVSASQINGTSVSANELVLQDVTTVGHAQLKVKDFSQGFPATDYLITVPAKTGTMALTNDITTVSGTNDGTNWTSLTIGSDTYSIPSGGSGGSYTFTDGLTESSGTVSWDLNDVIHRGSVADSIVIGTNPTSSSENARAKGALLGGYRENYNGTDATNFRADVTGKAGICYVYSKKPGQYSDGNITMVEGDGGVIFGNNRNSASTRSTSGFIYIVDSNSSNEQNRAYYSSSLGRCVASDGQGAHKGSMTIGEYNINDTTLLRSKAFIIGNGTSHNARSNALTVDWDGNIECNNIPAAPTTAGTYTLQVTVDDQGNKTFNWV